jgi:hypothetical protein
MVDPAIMVPRLTDRQSFSDNVRTPSLNLRHTYKRSDPGGETNIKQGQG